MIRPLLAACALTLGLMLSVTDARADAWLYVRDGIYLNARIGPGTRYRTHHVLSPGTRLQIIARVGDWAQVRTPEGLMLWVFFSYLMDRPPLERVRPSPPIIIVPAPTRPYVAPPPRRPYWTRPQPPYWTPPRPYPQYPHMQPQPQVRPKPQPPQQPKPPRKKPRTPQQQPPQQQQRNPEVPWRNFDPSNPGWPTYPGR